MARKVVKQRHLTVRMPEYYISFIDRLVEAGRYSNRSEVVREALRMLMRREERLAAGSGSGGGGKS